MLIEELHNILENILLERGYTSEMVDEQIKAIYEITLLELIHTINEESGKKLNSTELVSYFAETDEGAFSEKLTVASNKVMKDYLSIIS